MSFSFLQVQRRNVEFHVQSAINLHLELACAKLNDTRIQLTDTQHQLNGTQLQLRDTQGQLNNTQRQLDDTRRTSYDTQLQLRDTQGQLNDTRRQLNDTQLQLRDTQSQLNDTRRQSSNTQLQLCDTQIQLGNTQEKVNALESPSLMQISGVHTWKICGFKELVKQAKSGEKTLTESPPFYDHGYKFGLKLHPNWKLSSPIPVIFVGIFPVKGEYDPILSWPSPIKKITITLIDQQEDPRKRKNVVTTISSPCELHYGLCRRVGNDRNQYSVGQPLTSHDELTKRHYIVDDTIFIQVHIELL